MKIGIIVFSRTENTLMVAEKLQAACQAQGHSAEILRVHAEHEDPNDNSPVRLTETPDPTAYDLVFFGGPIQAFTLTRIMKVYVAQLPDMHGLKVGLFVTQHFPKAWMGGKQALGYMRKRCLSKGADVFASGGVNWMNTSRDTQMNEVVTLLTEGIPQ